VVVAPEVCAEMEALVASGTVRRIDRPYEPNQLSDAFLVVIATNDTELNGRIAADAHSAGCLVNAADEPVRGDCIFPAVVRRGALVISVTTGGASPSLVTRIQEWLEGELGPEYEEYVALLGEVRQAALPRIRDSKERKRALSALASDTEILEMIRAGRSDQARVKAFNCILPSSD
jgi:precorrin-2 dehydrogenase / sirohydrochlorin ferrochelatase